MIITMRMVFAHVISLGIGLFGSPVLAGETLTLVDYKQLDPVHIELKFDRHIEAAVVSNLPDVPLILLTESRAIDNYVVPRILGNSIVVDLSNEPAERETSVVLYVYSNCSRELQPTRDPANSCGSMQSVEFIRQSAKWLLDKFAFKRDNGYTILGRHSLAVQSSAPPELIADPLMFADKPMLTLSDDDAEGLPSDLQAHSELKIAGALVRYLWSQELRGGPTAMPYTSFIAEPFAQKLDAIRSGRFAVMCSGMRDLFLHATLAFPELKARAVEATNYGPQLNDLIAFSHSTAEVWVGALSRWVIIDPWMGISLVDRKGYLLSAGDLARLSGDTDLYQIPIVDKIVRYSVTGDGSRKQSLVRPIDEAMRDFTAVAGGVEPGYVHYFNKLIYRQAQLR